MAAPTTSVTSPAEKPVQTPAESKALAEAQRTGQATEVPEQLTENTTTLVNPNGTTTLRTHAQPVRVKQDGAWKGVDPKLKRTPDGSLVPIAAATGMKFSGGGTTPLVTLAEGGKQVSLSWPTPLPSPVVEGATATYPNVFPEVDLQVTAGVVGYSEVLVVKTAEAAKNPALAAVTLQATATGVTLETNADGVLSAKSADGKTVFHGSTPVMWDSTVDPKVGSKPNAVDPGSGKLTKLEVATKKKGAGLGARSAAASTTVDVEIKTDVEDLVAPGVKYPVYIDPVMSRYSEAWAEVTDNGWYYWNANMFAQVGYCSGWTGCGGSWRARSFFKFNVDALKSRGGRSAALFDAYFYANQVHGTQCGTAHPVALYQVNSFDSGTRWPGPWGFERARESSDAGDQCGGARDVRFNIIESARNMVEWNSDTFHFGLISPDENNAYQWKKFANNPHLDVTFSFPPGRATNTGVSNAVTCNGKLVTPDAHPTLYATSYDNNNPPLNVALWYEVWNSTGTKLHAKSTTGTVIASGSTGAWPVDTNLANGDWAYRVSTENRYPGDPGRNIWNGGWSDWTWFTTRGVPITTVPVISSEDYPKDDWGRPQDMPGTFTFNAGNAQNIVGFSYTFNGSGTERTPTTNECDYNKVFGNDGGWVANDNGSATITVPNTLSPGFHTVHVRSFDDAHKLSPESQAYTFYVAPTYVPAAQKERIEDDLLFTETADIVDFQRVSGAEYSGGTALHMQPRDGTKLTVTTTFRVRAEGDYELTLGLLGGTAQHGRITYLVDGRQAGRVSESWTPASATTTVTRQALGGVHLTAGDHTLTLKAEKNPASTDSRAKTGFDYLELTPTVKLDAELMPQLEATRALGVMPDCCSAKWHGGGQLRFEGDSSGQYFSLQITTPIEADYAISAGLTKAFHYGKYTVSVDGAPLGQTDTRPIDAYDPNVLQVRQPLGGVHLSKGTHKITFRAVGTNDASTDLRYRLGVDYLTVQPINNVTTASFGDAMNNRGIADDGVAGAEFDLSNGGLSAQTLAAAGLAPGQSAVIGGAKFTMPARNAAGYDNVIAIGQTIPFAPEQRVKANAVGLLVASTCGEIPAIPGTVTYADGTVSTPTVPKVIDWAVPHPERSGITLPYRLLGATKDHVWRPTLYPVFLPVDPNKTLKSITLPNYGTNPLPRACQQALHVLSMAPRVTEPGWVGAWSAPADAPIGTVSLQDKTLRTIVTPSVTGTSIRVKLSNAGVTKPVTIGAVSIAAGFGTDASTGAPTALKFGGSTSVTLPADGEVLSDPVPSPAGGTYVVSLHLPVAPEHVPAHEGIKSYVASGNQTADSSGTPFTTTLPGTYYLSRVDVQTVDTTKGTVAVVGDQLSASAPGVSTWTDLMPSKLSAAGVALPGGLVNDSRQGIADRSRWRLNDGSGTTARDASGRMPLTASGGVVWNSEQNGAAAFTNGLLAGSGPVLNSSRSYSVSAWVKLRNTGRTQVIVSQSGAANVSFALAYLEDVKSFAFITSSEDKAPAAAVPAAWSGSASPVNTWTHLLGTFDSATGAMRLYVNGQYAGAAVNLTPWNGTGPITIGGAKRTGGAVGDYFDGAVSDVRLHQHALSERDAALVHAEPHNRPYGAYANVSGVSASNLGVAMERSTMSAPGLRTVIVATGAPDLLAGVPASVVASNLTAALKANSPVGAKRSFRPDGTPLHVILTTVPPLNLSPSDPREQQRRDLNSKILSSWADFGADDVVDFDAAVRSPSDVSQIDGQYMSNGAINAKFHDRLATTMAEACADFPPRAEL
ncbi:LamG-like jellyroll fold domain-containing protein [Lentzea sp. NEAU-D7]|uniref:LamG-like jellyroll fold domain-containing protein n=1 Tax=Lentzea sp. NEAU-D7 TaxID=2994667 RepID=UPI00224A691D|nr:LamG-like jellyroll fold domain-containing protein [Lentzea sp. NEAU-D7]